MRDITVTPSLHGLTGLMPAKDWQAIGAAAVARWNGALASCCNVRLTVAAPQSLWLANEDGVSLIVLRQGLWCHNEMCGHTSTFPPNALAMTTVYPVGAKGAEVREADVEVNGQLLRALDVHSLPTASQLSGAYSTDSSIWVLGPHYIGNPVSLEAVLMHELGHVLGLSDACASDHYMAATATVVNCTVEQHSRLMFPDGRHLQPTAADLSELAATYPLSSHSQPLRHAFLGYALCVIAILVLVVWRVGRPFASRLPPTSKQR